MAGQHRPGSATRRRARGDSPNPPVEGSGAAAATGRSSDALRTLRVLVATGLTIVPLLQIVSDLTWLVEAWIGMAIVLLPAAALRRHRPAATAHLLPGLVLLILYLTHRYVPAHAWGGLIPTRDTWSDLSALSSQLGQTVADNVAPIHSTVAARLFLTAGLAVLAVLIDLVAIELRRPALTGVPILVLFAVSGAIPRHTVNLGWFALGACGYLLILSVDAHDQLPSWGRFIAHRAGRPSLSSAFSGRRIGLVAIAIAMVLPLAVPARSRDVLSDVLHNGNQGTGGHGNGTGVRLDPLAALKGQLTRSKPIPLFTVQIQSAAKSVAPFYLRSTVLDRYTGSAWVPGSSDSGQSLSLGFTVDGQSGPGGTTASFDATVTIQQLAGNAPVFDRPAQVAGLGSGWTWSTTNQVLRGNVRSGQHYTELVEQPDPSQQELDDAGAATSAATAADVELPNDIPASVRTLVAGITAGKTTAYAKARAISDYFHGNGFVYSLSTKGGDSGSDLVDFLQAKAGYCQQYAAAAAVMLRLAGIPARVVLGYTHPAADASGRFAVTSQDAHAWVEADFTSIGWIPFDPTPLVGGQATRAAALAWAPQAQTPTTSAAEPVAHPTVAPGLALPLDGVPTAASTLSGRPTASTGGLPAAVWAGGAGALVLLILLGALLPAVVRRRRRRRGLRLGGRGDRERLWSELADTAVDLELGWSNARTPRQVVDWLREMVLPGSAVGALGRLGGAIERQRYARPDSGPSDPLAAGADLALVADLREVMTALRAAVGRGTRIRAVLLPASVVPRLAGRAHGRRRGHSPAGSTPTTRTPASSGSARP